LTAALTGRTLAGHQADEAHELLGRSESREVADLGCQPDRGERVDPPDATQPCDQPPVRAVLGEPGKLCLEVLDAPVDLVEREQIVIERLLLSRQLERLAAEPRATRHTPARGRHPPVVTQDELPQPVPSAHPVQPRVLASANKIAQRLKLGRGHEDRCQEPASVQRSKTPSVALVGLHPITRPTRHQPRSDHHAVDPAAIRCRCSPKPVGPAS